MMKFLLLLLFIVVGLVNWVLISSYLNVLSIYKEGERVTAKAVEIISKPGNGHKGYKYKFSNSEQTFISYTKTRVDLHKKIHLVLPKDSKKRAFVVEKEGTYIEIYNGLTGGWISSLLLIVMHIALLRLTFMLLSPLLIMLRSQYKKFTKSIKQSA